MVVVRVMAPLGTWLGRCLKGKCQFRLSCHASEVVLLAIPNIRSSIQFSMGDIDAPWLDSFPVPARLSDMGHLPRQGQSVYSHHPLQTGFYSMIFIGNHILPYNLHKGSFSFVIAQRRVVPRSLYVNHNVVV